MPISTRLGKINDRLWHINQTHEGWTYRVASKAVGKN